MFEGMHVGLVVKDVEISSLFYRGVLGCELVKTYDDERIKVRELRAGTQIIELVQYLQGDNEERWSGVVDHIAFKVNDIDAAVRMLRKNEVRLFFETPRTVMGGKKIIFFAGPDGERLEFVQEAKDEGYCCLA